MGYARGGGALEESAKKKSSPRGTMEATLVFIKGAGAAMVQELSRAATRKCKW